MSQTVLDASALLALLRNEPGADLVAEVSANARDVQRKLRRSRQPLHPRRHARRPSRRHTPPPAHDHR